MLLFQKQPCSHCILLLLLIKAKQQLRCQGVFCLGHTFLNVLQQFPDTGFFQLSVHPASYIFFYLSSFQQLFDRIQMLLCKKGTGKGDIRIFIENTLFPVKAGSSQPSFQLDPLFFTGLTQFIHRRGGLISNHIQLIDHRNKRFFPYPGFRGIQFCLNKGHIFDIGFS